MSPEELNEGIEYMLDFYTKLASVSDEKLSGWIDALESALNTLKCEQDRRRQV